MQTHWQQVFGERTHDHMYEDNGQWVDPLILFVYLFFNNHYIIGYDKKEIHLKFQSLLKPFGLVCAMKFLRSPWISLSSRERNSAFSLLSIENWNHLYCEKSIHFFSHFIRKMYRTNQRNNELHKKLEQCFDPSQNPLVSQIHPLWLFIFKHFYSVLDVNKLIKYKIKVVRIDLHSFLSLSLFDWEIKTKRRETSRV